MEIDKKKLPTALAEEITLEDRIRKSLLTNMGRINHNWGNADSIPGQFMVRLAWTTAKIPAAARAIGSLFKSLLERAAGLFGRSGQPGHQQSAIQQEDMKEPGRTVNRDQAIDLELNNDLIPLLPGPTATPEDKGFALLLNEHRDDVPLDGNGREFYSFFERENGLPELTEKNILDAWENAKDSHGDRFRDYISHFDFLRTTPEMTALLHSIASDELKNKLLPLDQPATSRLIDQLKSLAAPSAPGELASYPESLKVGLSRYPTDKLLATLPESLKAELSQYRIDNMTAAMCAASLTYTLGTSPGGVEVVQDAMREFASFNSYEGKLTEPLFIFHLLHNEDVIDNLQFHLECLQENPDVPDEDYEGYNEEPEPLRANQDLDANGFEADPFAMTEPEPSALIENESILAILQDQAEFEQHANSPLKADYEVALEKKDRGISREVSISPTTGTGLSM